jgi:hypothetical protein
LFFGLDRSSPWKSFLSGDILACVGPDFRRSAYLQDFAKKELFDHAPTLIAQGRYRVPLKE